MKLNLRVILFITIFFLFCPSKNRTQVLTPVPSEASDSSIIRESAGEQTGRPAVLNEVSFQRDVLPILRELAGDCHTAEDKAGNYVLASYEAVMAGGTDSVPNVIPGKPDSSLLLLYLMKGHPFGKRPSPEKLEIIRNWILQGAKNN